MIRSTSLVLKNGRKKTAVLQHLVTLQNYLSAPIDVAWLVAFRIAFGVLMMWEVGRYFYFGKIARYYINPTFHFTYSGFGWVEPWPGMGMQVHFIVLGCLACCMALGLWYRYVAALFFLGFTYVFLLDQALYLNHFYLISLISFMMIWLPADSAFSLDRWRKGRESETAVGRWTRWWLLFQIGLVYFYGGVAKVNGDWLRGEPMRQWLAERTELPFVGPALAEPWAAFFFSYGGLAFDLLIVPFLLWRRTRLIAFMVAVLFHLTNALLFSIGIFPWFMIAATALFFEPAWPRRWFLRGASATALFSSTSTKVISPLLLSFLGLYVLLQIALPLRHFFYPGNSSWTEEGHRFSWHMKLRDKESETRFFVTVAEQVVEIVPANYLTERQVKKMSGRPDMMVQFAQYLADAYAEMGYFDIEVRVFAMVALNGREPRLLVDPDVDLLTVDTTEVTWSWILPLGDEASASAASAFATP